MGEIIASGEIGSPFHILWNYFFFVDPATNQYAGTAWRMDERYTGGFIIDAGVHNVALLRRLFGEFVSGRGLIRGVTPALGKYDTFSFQFVMDSGIDGVLNLFYSAKGMRANTVHVFGDEGTIILERDRLVVMKEGGRERLEEHPDDMGYRKEFENFFGAIRQGEKVISTIEEGCRDFEVIEKAVRATIEKRDADFTV